MALTETSSARRSGFALRLLLRVFLTLSAFLCGFAAAAMLAVAFFISPHAGLAGGAEVVLYGTGGAILFGVAAGFIVARLGSRALMLASVVAAIVLAALLVGGVWNQRETEEASPAMSSQPRPVTEPAPETAP